MSENNENQQTQERRPHFVKTIGKTTYLVTCHFIPDVGNQRRIIQFFRFHPEIFPGLLPLPFGVDNNRVYKFQNVLFTP